MKTLSISLPEKVADRVETETAKQGYASRSEFIRDLLRKYFANDLIFEVYEKRPISEVVNDLEKTGKYDKEFIDSIARGLKKSSKYAR